MAAVRAQSAHPTDSVVTVAETPHAAWTYEISDGRLTPVSEKRAATRRQESRGVFGLTGAGYVASPAFLREHRRFIVDGRTRPSIMSAERNLDIDTEADLRACDAVLSARSVKPVMIGDRAIGDGHPAYVIAEAGVNHNGDVGLAHRLVDAAADAGADAVKFQTFDPDRLVSEQALKAEYQKKATGAGESQKAMLSRLVLSHDAHRELQAHARQRHIEFLSSPFDEGSAEFLHQLGIQAFKIPSGEITNAPFLRLIASFGRPMLVSTGMCEMHEVAEAVDLLQAAGDPPVALLHCVSNYPAEARSANLAAMRTLRSGFQLPVGWSDHTLGIEVALGAVARGACIVEKHLTLSRSLPGPDHAASLEPEDLRALVRGLRAVESAIGDGVKRPQDEELGTRSVARKSVHWAKDRPAGHRVEASDLVLLRPGDGLPPSRVDRLIGSTLARDVRAGAKVFADDAAVDESR